MKDSIRLLLVIFLISAICGCKKGGAPTPEPFPDTTKPTISVSKPTPGQFFTAGNAIIFQASFSDNEKLASYEISVTRVVSGGFFLKVVPALVPFSFTKSPTSFNPGVKQQEINITDIIIPLNTTTTIVTPGKYNFKVSCNDASNNSASTTTEININ